MASVATAYNWPVVGGAVGGESVIGPVTTDRPRSIGWSLGGRMKFRGGPVDRGTAGRRLASEPPAGGELKGCKITLCLERPASRHFIDHRLTNSAKGANHGRVLVIR
jgi:hypothetical protein